MSEGLGSYVLWIAAAVAVTSIVVATLCIVQLVRGYARSVATRLPLAGEQSFDLPEGRYTVNLDGPRNFAAIGMGMFTLDVTLTHEPSGREVPTWPAFFALQYSGFARARRPLWSFRLTEPGPHRLRVAGIPDREGLRDYQFVLTRPTLGFLWLAGTGASGFCFILSTVALALGLFSGSSSSSGGASPNLRVIDETVGSRVDACLDGIGRFCEGLGEEARSRCEGGEADACFGLGLLLTQGKTVSQDLAAAAVAFQSACDGGEALGCINVGWAYWEGSGVEQDPQRATALLARGCEMGRPLGCHNLGVVRSALGDHAAALPSFERACRAGYAASCHNAAGIYRNGSGVDPDPARADELYRQACAAGIAVSCSALEAGGENVARE